MESLPRITRRMAHKLLKEKSLPNRLQRLCSGGFKRKADFFTLSKGSNGSNKRMKINGVGSGRGVSVSPLKEVKSENIDLSDFGDYSGRNEEIRIIVDLPVIHALSPNTLKVVAELEDFEDPYQGPSSDGDYKPLLDRVNLDSESSLDDGVTDGFQPFSLSLAFDTDSEDQSPWGFDGNPMPGVEVVEISDEKVEEDHEEAVTSNPTDAPESLESERFQVAEVFEKMPERDVRDDQNCKEGGSLMVGVKEEIESEEEWVGLGSEKGRLGKEDRRRGQRLKGRCRLGPRSRWLYSGSRFAAFLRKAGVIDLDPEEDLLQNKGKAASKQKLFGVEGGYIASTPPHKQQTSRFPGKKKVTLSPSSQLKLLEASRSSSYRRMLPFCNEMAKDLARASAAQATTEILPRESLPLKHIKSEKNETELALVIFDQGPNGKPISMAHVEVEQNESQKELLSDCEEKRGNPLCTGHVKLEQNESQMELTPTDADVSRDLLGTGHVKLEQTESQMELTPTDLLCTGDVKLEQTESEIESTPSDAEMSMGLLGLGDVKLEQNNSIMESPLVDQETNMEPIVYGHANLEQNIGHMKLLLSGEEQGREPLPIKHAKLEDMSQPESVISDGLSSACLCIGHVKFEESGSQPESVHIDQFLSRKSLFTEHVKAEQNKSQLEVATSVNGLGRVISSIECIEPQQSECQLEPAPIYSQSSSACLPHGSSVDLGKTVASRPSTNPPLSFSSGQCISPIPLYKSPALDSNNMVLADHKSPPSLGSANFTFCPSNVEDPSPLHTPASLPSRGILKVSPRPCKGVCMCSDCGTFRLQAERASEFSERQLREVEALAVTLMNELANVRNVMEKSLIKLKGVRIPYLISHSEVKEASKSAIKAEETARSQLVQMTRDCNLHCKILRMQQRRVKFADKIEVKLFKSE